MSDAKYKQKDMCSMGMQRIRVGSVMTGTSVGSWIRLARHASHAVYRGELLEEVTPPSKSFFGIKPLPHCSWCV
jgi:hypothetical protein